MTTHSYLDKGTRGGGGGFLTVHLKHIKANWRLYLVIYVQMCWIQTPIKTSVPFLDGQESITGARQINKEPMSTVMISEMIA